MTQIAQIARPGGTRLHIAWATWATIRDVYERLSGTPGTGARAEAARAASRRYGWATTMDWDDLDIDDPRVEAVCSGPAKVTARTIARDHREQVRALMGSGLTVGQIAQRVGISQRQASRHVADVKKGDAA